MKHLLQATELGVERQYRFSIGFSGLVCNSSLHEIQATGPLRYLPLDSCLFAVVVFLSLSDLTPELYDRIVYALCSFDI